MKILQVANTYPPHVGGVARSVEAFGNEYRKRGHQVLFIAPKFAGQAEGEQDVVRIAALQNFNGSGFSVVLPIPHLLNSVLDEFQPDLVHSHTPFLLGSTAVRIALQRKIPLVFTHHTMYDQYLHYMPVQIPRFEQFINNLVTGYCNLCDQVVAPSESVAEVIRQNGVETPIVSIPTGVQIESFANGDGQSVRKQYRIPPHARVIGYVGRLAQEKNLTFLAQAVALLMEKRPRTHFLVVGDGGAKEEIQKIFAEKNMANRLHLTGSLEGQPLVDAYHALDLFAFASFTETQGMVLTEAMSVGVPVVALEAAGAREVVRDRVNGRLIQTENIEEFCAALDWCLRQPAKKRGALQQAARATSEDFSMEHCADRMLRLYESLLPKGSLQREIEGSAWNEAIDQVQAEWTIIKNYAGAVLETLEISPSNS